MKYLVVIPAYNEEKEIRSVVSGVLSITNDVLVVDDGSFDATYAKVKPLGIAVIRQVHQGKGAALKAGFGYAAGHAYDWVITMDGDGQHDWREIPKFIEKMSEGGIDIVVGSRMKSVSSMPLLRLMTNWTMSSIISRLVGRKMPDTQCGFRAIRTKVLQAISLSTSHFDTESEVLIKAGKKGFVISSVPVKTIYNGAASDINKITDTVRFFNLVWRSL